MRMFRTNSMIASEWESFCVPIIESIAFGTPVIGRNIPPIPETMGDGGILVDMDKLDESALLVAELWDDAERYATMQEAGRVHADRFTDHQLHQGVSQLLEQYVGRGQP